MKWKWRKHCCGSLDRCADRSLWYILQEHVVAAQYFGGWKIHLVILFWERSSTVAIVEPLWTHAWKSDKMAAGVVVAYILCFFLEFKETFFSIILVKHNLMIKCSISSFKNNAQLLSDIINAPSRYLFLIQFQWILCKKFSIYFLCLLYFLFCFHF